MVDVGFGLHREESVFIVSFRFSQEFSSIINHGFPEFGHSEDGLEISGDTSGVVGLSDESVSVEGAMIVIGLGTLSLESTVGTGLGDASDDSFREVGLTGESVGTKGAVVDVSFGLHQSFS